MSLVLWIVLGASAWAHHDTAVAQVDVSTEGQRLGEVVSQAPRLDLGLGYGVSDYGRSKRGARRYGGRELGAVGVHVWTGRAALHLKGGSALQVSVPLAVVSARSAEGTTVSSGLADVRVDLSQRLGGVTAQLGVVLPTGATAGRGNLSVTDVAESHGELVVTTYATRASLGSGAVAVVGSVGGVADTGPMRLGARVRGHLPVTDTPDEIRWGHTVGGTLWASRALVEDRLVVDLQAGVEHHSADAYPVLDEDSNLPVQARTGRRSVVDLGVRLTAQVSERTQCSVGSSVPVWQQVQGVQLVQTVRASTHCAVGVGLRREAESER